MTTKVQWSLYRKEYETLSSKLAPTAPAGLQPKEALLYELAYLRTQIWEQTCLKKETPIFKDLNRRAEQVCASYEGRVEGFVIYIHQLAIRAFIFEIETDIQAEEKEDLENKLTKQICKLPSIWEVRQHVSSNGLFFEISVLELYVRKNTKSKSESQRQELDLLSRMVEQLASKQPETKALCKRMYMILVHLKLHYSNLYSTDLGSQTLSYLQLAINALQPQKMKVASKSLLSNDTVVVLLYNCLKTMLGFNHLSEDILNKLNKLMKLFGIEQRKKSYSIYLLQMFFIIKMVIFQRKHETEQNETVLEKLTEFSEKFSVFLNCNMDEVVVGLNEITRNIIRHKVASLSTIIVMKLGINRFSKDFLEIMHDSPFNNDVQTIKLCFELFEFREFEKIVNLLQTVLSVPATKSLKMREVLIAMCSILIGLYLENREEGLLYCKLNHENYQANSKLCLSKANEILKEETFLAHVGFGYYNIACHEAYRENREIYLCKALENFLNSYRLNTENYLLNYCISKIYLQLYDYPNAYKHAMEACKSHRGSWAPFCLLACVYMSERKFHKSYLLIEELLKKYPRVPVLHYVRAYLEVNKILLEVEHDEEIEAAKMLGDQYYTMHFERLLKHKSINSVVQYCQNYFQLSCGNQTSEPDENFFVGHNIASEAGDREKELIQILGLLEELGQLNMMENILKVLQSNSISTLYYKAVVHERRREVREAREEYLNILKLEPTHCETLIRLSQLPENDSIQAYKDCRLYLETASKFVNHAGYCLARGVVESRLGNYAVASEYLLAVREQAWCKVLPDLFYYY